ncbi:MAG: hypothetical protein J7516_14205, partial [Shinella sp.]|nr:hypothetical protein [Shinella sp.]
PTDVSGRSNQGNCDRIALLTGGNGAAAKSSDEIGRIGADLVIRGHMDEPDYTTDFAVHFR